MRLGILAAMLMMRSPDNGDGGGGEGGEPPPEVLPVEQPAAQPDLTARMAALEQQNQQLFQQNQMLLQRQAPAAPAQQPGSGLPDESQLHPDLVKLLKHKDEQWAGRLEGLRDQFDHQSFQQQLTMVNAPPEITTQAEALFGAWKQNGMKVLNGNGVPVSPTRADALRFVMGSMAMEGKLPSFKPGLPAMGGAPMRSGAPPMTAPAAPDTGKMSRTERITYYESRLDEEGF